ncbi:MAG: DUF4258 domain-containing protein [Acidobacteriota bacterium]
MTSHADEEMRKDLFSVFDVEHGLLVGSVVDRQRDEKTGEWKYVCQGESLEHRLIGIVFKLSPTRKLVIITVYGEEE